MAKLSTQVVEQLRKTIDTACADISTDIPGTAVVVVDKNGDELFAHAAGKRGLVSSEPMTLESTFWIASCTKAILGISAMQLVEQGKLKLDDGAHLEEILPELKAIKVLQDDGQLVDKKRSITLRMLLSHTAGFGYTFFSAKLRDHGFPVGYDEFSGSIRDVMMPLVNQPGERWEYGVNIDWAGIAVERVSGLSLNDYFHKNIFEPLGLKNISMIPSQSMKQRLAYMHQRDADGKLTFRDHLLHLPLVVETRDEIKQCFNSAGAGCFATPRDYCQILATLLNNGASPTTRARILRPETVDEMFRNQIPSFPDFGRQSIAAAKPALTNAVPELYPVAGNPPQGWGLTFMLTNGGASGRSTATAMWAGLPNCWWWCDRVHGIAGMVCSQILPFGDIKVLTLWLDVETQIYKALGVDADVSRVAEKLEASKLGI